METLQKFNTLLHIAGGFTALLVGLVPMLAKKGGRMHILAGRVFFWAMMGVSFSAATAFFIKPFSDGRLFLLFVGVFSFYLTFTGVRIVRHKNGARIGPADRAANGLGALAGLAMLGLGGWFLYGAGRGLPGGSVFFGVMYGIFGTALLNLVRADWLYFRRHGRASPVRMAWFFTHMERILGAYIATVTAFLVVNVHFLPPLLVWITPGVVGGIGISRWVAHYRKKFGVDKRAVAEGG